MINQDETIVHRHHHHHHHHHYEQPLAQQSIEGWTTPQADAQQQPPIIQHGFGYPEMAQTQAFGQEIPYHEIKYEPLKYDYPVPMSNIYETQKKWDVGEPIGGLIEPVDTIDEKSLACSTSDGRASSAECSMSPDSVIPLVKRGRPTENPCWNYFVRIDDQLVRCRICTKVVKSACATNMTKHLERHHVSDYEKLLEQIRVFKMTDTSTRIKTPIMATSKPIPSQSYPPPYEAPIPYYDPSMNLTYPNANQLFDEQQWQLNHYWSNEHDGDQGVTPPVAQMMAQKSVIDHAPSRKSAKSQQDSKSPQWFLSAPAERPYMKRNRKTEHPVWEYFKRTADGHAQCAICNGCVKSPCSSNFMRHLMRHHTNEYNDVYLKWVQKRNLTNQNASTSTS